MDMRRHAKSLNFGLRYGRELDDLEWVIARAILLRDDQGLTEKEAFEQAALERAMDRTPPAM